MSVPDWSERKKEAVILANSKIPTAETHHRSAALRLADKGDVRTAGDNYKLSDDTE